jgi:hypothetical protein
LKANQSQSSVDKNHTREQKVKASFSLIDGTFDKETSELVSTDKQELLVQQLGALKDLSLKLNPPSEPEL